MKRLTLNLVARANLRINRKSYVNLFLGILLAVFLAAATSLCAWGTIRGHEEQMAQRVGWMDMFMLGNNGLSDEQIRSTGYFREIGHVTVSAAVNDTAIYAGYYDETAEKLLNRTLAEGRLPEKAGELAAERSALIRLDLNEAKAGDVLTLAMKPVGGIPEEKTFTLVGILNEQTEYLETYSSFEEGMGFPAMLVSPEESWDVGSAVVHRVVTYAPLITFNQVVRHLPAIGSENAYGVSRETGTVVWYDSGWDRASNTLNRILPWLVLGAALMLSSCVGITSAMESLLSRKTEDIGMLRAIGATRRQIRRIYGAEAWLLACTALPAGLLAGVLAAWIVSRIAPDQVVFSLNGWLLVPILGLSAVCVFAASRLPLYRASRQMPMGVLRDTGMLRRAGSIRSRREFRPARLIAGRRTRLYPLRQAGAACMIALTLFSTLMLGELALGMNPARWEQQAAFRLYADVPSEGPEIFSQYLPEETLSRAELNKINDIQGVSRSSSLTGITANLILDSVPDYFRNFRAERKNPDGTVDLYTVGTLAGLWARTDWLFYSPEDLADARARRETDWEAAENVAATEQAGRIREKLGLTGTVVPVRVYVADLDADALREYVTDGAIDPDRLDSGEQVLVYAPNVCVKQEEGTFFSDFMQYGREIREEDWDLVIRNDAFTAGMKLSLLELASTDPEALEYGYDTAEPDWKAYYEPMEAVRAETTVGAVLSGPALINGTYPYSFAVIVSPKGAQAMGLKLPNPEYMDVYLSGDPTKAEEQEIDNSLRQIAMRGSMSVDNRLELTRAYMAKKLRQILLFAALILLFFAVSVFMQVNGTARQIRSETRTIGTLRAVGADLKTLVGCYSLPVWICAAAALVPCLLFYAVTRIPGLRLFTENHPLVMIPVLCVLAACVALACIAGIRGRLAGVTRQSTVENIREL